MHSASASTAFAYARQLQCQAVVSPDEVGESPQPPSRGIMCVDD